MTMNRIKATIKAQINEAKVELDAYDPSSVDWHDRCLDSTDTLLPWLHRVAPGLSIEIDALLGSPHRVRAAWDKIKDEFDIPEHLKREMDQSLERESFLVQRPSGALISKIIERYLIEHYPEKSLKSNGASDYPDLYVSDFDYTFLSPHIRTASKYAASLKGGRPRANACI